MAHLFISYRREDSSSEARAIHSWLTDKLGPDSTFMDLGIRPGDNWAHSIKHQLASAHVVLAIIGPRWLTAADPDGLSRLESLDDMVRREIISAFNSGIRVIPILVNDAKMPRADELPDELQPLAKRNAFRVRSANFAEDMLALRSHIGSYPAAAPGSTSLKKKICMVGLAGVGKTSLVRRYVMSLFSESYFSGSSEEIVGRLRFRQLAK